MMVSPPEESAETSSVVQEVTMDPASNIENLFKEGHALYKQVKFEEASEKLALATKEAVALYGDFAPECFEPHYYYGRALLEIARSESSLLGLSNESNEEEEEKDETLENLQKAAESTSEEKSTSEVLGKNDEKMEDEPEDIEDEACEETLNGTANEEEDDSSSGVAWEILEVARNICEKQGDKKEWLLRKADVFVSLADCLLIQENFPASIKEYNSALEIHTKLSEPFDRKIAEIHFGLGQAYKISTDFCNAVKFFEKSAEVFRLAIENATEPTEKESLNKLRDQIIECIDDAKESDIAIKKQEESQKVEMRNVMTKLFVQEASNEQAKDITNLLVRKGTKRAAEESVAPNLDSIDSEAKIQEPDGKKIREE